VSLTSISSLREQQHPLIRQLANRIEAIWERYLDLAPYPMPPELGYVEGRLEGERLTIENRCYQTPQFRKLHLELARVGATLDILHCVMFPRANYPLPMFGTDLVAGKGQMSAAIVDLSPVSADKCLPVAYQQELAALAEVNFSQPRPLPEWADIFSDFCLFVRPNSSEEDSLFLSRVESYLEIHVKLALKSQPVSGEEATQVIAGQRYYCTKQQKNDKTRRVLEKAFGPEWAEHYMTTVLFDGAD
jgi:phycocyanobilin:ferredoxin oxidoreductase